MTTTSTHKCGHPAPIERNPFAAKSPAVIAVTDCYTCRTYGTPAEAPKPTIPDAQPITVPRGWSNASRYHRDDYYCATCGLEEGSCDHS